MTHEHCDVIWSCWRFSMMVSDACAGNLELRYTHIQYEGTNSVLPKTKQLHTLWWAYISLIEYCFENEKEFELSGCCWDGSDLNVKRSTPLLINQSNGYNYMSDEHRFWFEHGVNYICDNDNCHNEMYLMYIFERYWTDFCWKYKTMMVYFS